MAQLALVDVYLEELQWLGVDGVRLRDIYYFEGLTGIDLFPIYDRAWFGVTRRPHETAYVVNEAHRRGMSVIIGNAYFGLPQTRNLRTRTLITTKRPANEFYNQSPRLQTNRRVQFQWAVWDPASSTQDRPVLASELTRPPCLS